MTQYRSRVVLVRSKCRATRMYCVHCVKGVTWVRVRIVFVGAFHVPTTAIPPLSVYVTVPVFIASLNVTTIGAVNGTPFAPLAGSVVLTKGLMPTVWKLQGFGTGPGSRRFADLSEPPVICAVYGASSAKAVAWLRVRTVSVGEFQDCVKVSPPLTVYACRCSSRG